jgi:hypothetical protein
MIDAEESCQRLLEAKNQSVTYVWAELQLFGEQNLGNQ